MTWSQTFGCLVANEIERTTMRVLVIGGAASGKSAYAESVAMCFPGERVYLATMQPFGAEGARRIERHRALRAGKGFATAEVARGLDSCDEYALAGACEEPAGATVLLECLGTLLANEMFDDDGVFEAGPAPADRVVAGVERLERLFGNVVVVTNDVGCDLGDFSDETHVYIHELGRANAVLASRFDRVVEVINSIPVTVKEGESPCGR